MQGVCACVDRGCVPVPRRTRESRYERLRDVGESTAGWLRRGSHGSAHTAHAGTPIALRTSRESGLASRLARPRATGGGADLVFSAITCASFRHTSEWFIENEPTAPGRAGRAGTQHTAAVKNRQRNLAAVRTSLCASRRTTYCVCALTASCARLTTLAVPRRKAREMKRDGPTGRRGDGAPLAEPGVRAEQRSGRDDRGEHLPW